VDCCGDSGTDGELVSVDVVLTDRDQLASLLIGKFSACVNQSTLAGSRSLSVTEL